MTLAQMPAACKAVLHAARCEAVQASSSTAGRVTDDRGRMRASWIALPRGRKPAAFRDAHPASKPDPAAPRAANDEI